LAGLALAAVGFRAPDLLRLPPAADTELVSRFQRGERQAFEGIVLRYQARIYSLCLRWLGEPEVAEEVAQDVFVALFRSLPTFRGDSSLSTFVFRIAVNHCKNKRVYRHRRAHGRHDALGPAGTDEDLPERDVADETAATDRGTIQGEAARIVTRALAELDDDHRQILVLRDVDDLSYEEIADLLDLPRGTVKSRIHRARAELASVVARLAPGAGA
jgi:RNA polymerase sigma-70 factor (ECF subfamily)